MIPKLPQHETLALRTIHLAHHAVVLFVFLGWLAPWKSVLLVHAGFIPLMILHWQLNQNRCCLTNLEAKLKARSQESKETSTQDPSGQEGGFLRDTWTRISGRTPTDQALCRVAYGIPVAAWVLSAVRLFLNA